MEITIPTAIPCATEYFFITIDTISVLIMKFMDNYDLDIRNK